jgi:hypothetical protein
MKLEMESPPSLHTHLVVLGVLLHVCNSSCSTGAPFSSISLFVLLHVYNSGCSTDAPLLLYIIGCVHSVAHLQNSFNPLASSLKGIDIIGCVNFVAHLHNYFEPFSLFLKRDSSKMCLFSLKMGLGLDGCNDNVHN